MHAKYWDFDLLQTRSQELVKYKQLRELNWIEFPTDCFGAEIEVMIVALKKALNRFPMTFI